MKYTVVFCLFLGVLSAVIGQDNIPVVTDNVFIRNAHITIRPGVTLEKASVLLKNGLIAAIGTSLQQPIDAEIIEGDSLYVYAGFIAPASHIGIPKPKEDNDRPRVKRPGYPPNDVAGIVPETTLVDQYDASNSQIKAFRNEGFGISQILPYGRMMPGQASIISLNGKPFNEALIRDASGLYAQLTGTRGVYPSTIIGVMAKWREMYKQAKMAMGHTVAYQKNPANLQRPNPDKALLALYPVIRGTMPVLFQAPKHLDINRVIQLQKDLGFMLILVEVQQGAMAIEHIKTHAKASLLSLDLPKALPESKKEEEKVDPDIEKLQIRKKEAIKQYEGQGAAFAGANLPFAFSFLEVKPIDIHGNINRLIKAGLSPDQALDALTTAAAKTLGIESVAGTVEKGKVANLVVTTKPLFSEEAKIKMVFVDGVKHELSIKEKKDKKEGDVALNLVGMWDYAIDIPGMMPKGTMKFTKNGDNYDIDLTNDQNSGEIISVKDVELSGNEMSLEYEVDAGGVTVTVLTNIEFDENSFEGEVTVADFGSFPVNGDKQSNPNND